MTNNKAKMRWYAKQPGSITLWAYREKDSSHPTFLGEFETPQQAFANREGYVYGHHYVEPPIKHARTYAIVFGNSSDYARIDVVTCRPEKKTNKLTHWLRSHLTK